MAKKKAARKGAPARARPAAPAAGEKPPATPAVPAKRGRPTKYSEALGRTICEQLAAGRTLRVVCGNIGLDESTVRDWGTDPAHPLFPAFARAREIGLYSMADEIVEIADDRSEDFKLDPVTGRPVLDREHVKRSELRISSRKWMLEKLLAKVFGNKTQLEGGDKPIEVNHNASDALISRIAGLAARAEKS